MEFGATIEWNQMEHIQVGYIIAAVNIDGFKQSDCDPQPQDDEVVRQEQDAPEESHTQDQCLCRVSVFCCHAKRRLKMMVNLMDMLVDTFIMQSLVQKIMPCILNHSAAKHTQGQVVPRRHFFPAVWYTKHLSEDIGATYERELNDKVIEH